MFDLKKIPLPAYSTMEDRVNCITHAVGVPLCIIGGFILIKPLFGHATSLQIFSAFLYLGTSCLVFLGSAIYHGLAPSFAKQIARVIDHSNIYIMISGMATSLYLNHVYPERPELAKGMIIAMWAASAVGIVLTFMDLKRFNIPQIFMYLVLGWSCIFSMKTIYNSGEAAKQFAITFIIGGICVSIGAILYLIGKKKRYFHAVFHVFVLVGSIIFFIATNTYNLAAVLPN